MLCFEVYRPIELSLEKKPAFADYSKNEKMQIVKDEIMQDFDPSKKREISRSTIIRSSTDQTFYPFESMDGNQLQQEIMTSKQMMDSQISLKNTKKLKDEMKEFKEETARFSKVRRMTDKNQQRLEFE